MAHVFDMSSGKIQSENTGITRITEHLDPLEIGPALQEICEIPEDATQDAISQHHIRELLKKL